MKAGELAKLLLQNPDAEVTQTCYTGCMNQSKAINDLKLIKEGEKCNPNGGDHLDEAGFAKKDIVLLS